MNKYQYDVVDWLILYNAYIHTEDTPCYYNVLFIISNLYAATVFTHVDDNTHCLQLYRPQNREQNNLKYNVQ